MQSETRRDIPGDKLELMGQPSSGNQPANSTLKNSTLTNSSPTPSVTRTRCPACQKLFAIETDTLMAMTRAGAYRAEFSCTSEFCRTPFAIQLPLPVGFDGVGVLPAIQISKDVSLEFRDRPDIDFVETETPAQKIREQNDVSKALVLEKECPRCNAKNATTMNECVRCGIVFDRNSADRFSNDRFSNDAYEPGELGPKTDQRIEEEVALGGTRELAALWDRVMEDYEDRVRHDRFLNACRDSKALSYAAKKYSQILVSAPQDEAARMMRNRIVAMVSAQAESSRIPIHLNFRIPSLNAMALAMGSILFFWGLMMPQLKNIMEIGLSMLLLTIGVRLALRARV